MIQYNKLFVFIFFGVVIMTGIFFLIMYLTKSWIFKKSSSDDPVYPPAPGNIVGAWINASNPPYDDLKKMDLAMLASYTPNPWDLQYNCELNPGFSLFPTDYTDLKAMVDQVREITEGKVLLSLGGSSFGKVAWGALVYKYIKDFPPRGVGQCPGASYWFTCNPNPDSPCDGTSFEIYQASGDTFCHYSDNPHKCCCQTPNVIETIDGVKTCLPNYTPNSCAIPGIINQVDYDHCVTDAGDDNVLKYLCIINNTDPVEAFAKALIETGADGIDFDFESTDDYGDFAIGLIDFSHDLKARMKDLDKDIILTVTILSGPSYRLIYGPLYDIMKTKNSPFDYVIPMLYNGGQYPYGVQEGENFTWNGLLDTWSTNGQYMSKDGNTKLIPAFIEYLDHPAFQDSDLTKFFDEYIESQNNNLVKSEGVVYFYYSTDYNIELLNQNLERSYDCIKNGINC